MIDNDNKTVDCPRCNGQAIELPYELAPDDMPSDVWSRCNLRDQIRYASIKQQQLTVLLLQDTFGAGNSPYVGLPEMLHHDQIQPCGQCYGTGAIFRQNIGSSFDEVLAANICTRYGARLTDRVIRVEVQSELRNIRVPVLSGAKIQHFTAYGIPIERCMYDGIVYRFAWYGPEHVLYHVKVNDGKKTG